MLTRLRARRRAKHGDAGITLIELVVAMTIATIVATLTTALFVTSSNVNSKTTNTNVATSAARAVLDSWAALISVADAPTIPYVSNVPQNGSTAQPTAGTAADRIINITPTELTFWADVNNRPSCGGGNCISTAQPNERTQATYVDLSYVPSYAGATSGSLVETRYLPGSTTTVQTKRTVIASGVSTNGWLFTPYLEKAYGGCTAGLICTPVMCNGAAGICLPTPPVTSGLDPAVYLSYINRIDISFTVTPNNGASVGATTSTLSNGAPVTYTTTVAISEVA